MLVRLHEHQFVDGGALVGVDEEEVGAAREEAEVEVCLWGVDLKRV